MGIFEPGNGDQYPGRVANETQAAIPYAKRRFIAISSVPKAMFQLSNHEHLSFLENNIV